MVDWVSDFARWEATLAELCETGELDFMPVQLKSMLFEWIFYMESWEKRIHRLEKIIVDGGE